jgi:hypothetical protein
MQKVRLVALSKASKRFQDWQEVSRVTIDAGTKQFAANEAQCLLVVIGRLVERI